MKTVLLALLLILMLDQTNDIIVWSNSRKLQIEDFKCVPQTYSRHSASSFVGITSTIEPVYMGWKLTVYAYFDKSKSWIKTNEISSQLLGHEQCHFDLMQEGALQTLIEVGKLRNKPDVRNEMRRIADSISERYDQIQSLYDFETNYSQNVSEQSRWEEQTKFKIDSLSSILVNTDYVIVK
ncbi:MAG: DUF922 domain-containing protein [Flavobacteriales bacterium]